MKIQTVNTIETSSLCDNKCEYCPSPLQGHYRETGFMTMNTFEKAIEVVTQCVRMGTQKELNLFGVGEPTLNPNIIEMVRMARAAMPLRLPVHLNTNGNSMTYDFAIKLRDAGISHIDITGHNARSAAKAIRIFQDVGIKGQLSFDFITAPNNWAGQVDWFEPTYNAGPCPWINNGQIMIMSDGNITRCCIDAFGTGVFSNVNNTDVIKSDVSRFELCTKCHHTI